MVNLLGLHITRAGGQRLRATGTAFDDRTRLNAIAAARLGQLDPRQFSSQTVQAGVGFLPATATPSQAFDRSLGTRQTPGDPLADWWLQVPDKMEPKQVSSMLRSALAGNIWQLHQLTNRMLLSWGMFRKCVHEIRAVTSSANYVVHPYRRKGKDPSRGALEKAEFVERNWDSFRPNRFTDEEGRSGMVYDLTNALCDGISFVEMLWDLKARDDDGNPEHRVRAGAWVHPRHLMFGQDGSLGIVQAEGINLLQFPNQFGPTSLLKDPKRFLVAKAKTKSGSPLGCGWTHVLAYPWITVMYGRDFMLAFAQKYGNPFLDIAYQAGIGSTEISRFEDLAKRAANQGYIVHPNSGVVQITEAKQLGTDNPIVRMMRMADEWCQQLILGQTLTSSTPTDGGTRAQGEVHGMVLDSKKKETCDWIAEILTEQFCESLMLENYAGRSGDYGGERPHMEADLSKPLTMQEKGDFIAKISTSPMPLCVEPLYKAIDMAVPKPGEVVQVQGQHVIFEEPVTPTEHRQQQAMEQIEMQAVMAGYMPAPEPEPEPKDKGKGKAKGKEKAKAKGGKAKATAAALRLVLAKASTEELQVIKAQLAKCQEAKAAGRLNGEWSELAGTLNRIAATQVAAPQLIDVEANENR